MPFVLSFSEILCRFHLKLRDGNLHVSKGNCGIRVDTFKYPIIDMLSLFAETFFVALISIETCNIEQM